MKDVEIPILNDGVVDFALSFGFELNEPGDGARIGPGRGRVSVPIRDAQRSTTLDWSFATEVENHGVLAGTRRADGLLLVAGMRPGEGIARTHVVVLNPDGSKAAEWPTVC